MTPQTPTKVAKKEQQKADLKIINNWWQGLQIRQTKNMKIKEEFMINQDEINYLNILLKKRKALT